MSWNRLSISRSWHILFHQKPVPSLPYWLPFCTPWKCFHYPGHFLLPAKILESSQVTCCLALGHVIFYFWSFLISLAPHSWNVFLQKSNVCAKTRSSLSWAPIHNGGHSKGACCTQRHQGTQGKSQTLDQQLYKLFFDKQQNRTGEPPASLTWWLPTRTATGCH